MGMSLLLTQWLEFVLWSAVALGLKKCIGPGTIWRFCVVILTMSYTDTVIQQAYLPMYVVVVGHHVLIIGFISFLLGLLKHPVMTRLCNSDLSKNSKYVPILSELLELGVYKGDAACAGTP